MVFTKFLDKGYEFLSRRWVYHSLFWLVFFCVLLFFGVGKQRSFGFMLSNEIISLVLFAVLVYFNLLFLIPKFLLKKRVLLYGVLLIAACLVITPIKTFVFYLKFSSAEDLQDHLVDNQEVVFYGNLLIGIFSTILSILTGWWRFQQQTQQIATQNMANELRFLRNQINPHFLFNTLNNLYSLTLKKSEKAPEIVLKLAEIMRYMLYECNDKQVLLSKEIQYMENYLDLERLRQPNTVEISVTTEGRVSHQMVAPLLFIPFLENAFKHGVQNQIAPGGFVHVRLRVQDDDLEFFIENSKPAHTPKNEGRRSGGIGLANVRQRLQLLYPENHELHVENDPNRYAVTLLIQL